MILYRLKEAKMLEIKDKVTLSNGRKYLVTSKAIYKNNIYYLLIDDNDLNNVKIVLETKRKTLKEVLDKELITKLALYFVKNSVTVIKEDLKN